MHNHDNAHIQLHVFSTLIFVLLWARLALLYFMNTFYCHVYGNH